MTGKRHEAYTERLERITRNLVDHELVLLGSDPSAALYHFRLQKPGGSRVMSSDFIFTKYQTFITGDYSPCTGPNGVTSNLGNGLGWFAGKLSPDYLASKFLDRVWCKLNAEDWYDDLCETDPDDEEWVQCTACKGEGYVQPDDEDECETCDGEGKVPPATSKWAAKLKEALGDNSWGSDFGEGPFDTPHLWHETFKEVISEAGWDNESAYPNNVYEIGNWAMLTACHAKFRELFWAQYSEVTAQGVAVLKDTEAKEDSK